MKVLVDTNVYLDLLLRREGYEAAKEFFYLCILFQNQTYATSQTLRDSEYYIKRALHNQEIAKKLQHKIYEITSKIIPISADTAIEALYSPIDDYEDALQSLAAEETLLDGIVTNNKKDFANSNLPVFTPNEICWLWKNNKNERKTKRDAD